MEAQRRQGDQGTSLTTPDVTIRQVVFERPWWSSAADVQQYVRLSSGDSALTVHFGKAKATTMLS